MKFTVSLESYKDKPTSYENIHYEVKNMDVKELSEKISQGYLFTGIYDFDSTFMFFGDGVKKNHYIGSMSVNIDCDGQLIPMEKKMAQMSLKPTIAYKSFSDGVKGYCYHFVYCFNETIYGYKNYNKIYKKICKVNNIKYDKGAADCYHLFNGTNKDVIIDINNLYNIKDYNLKCNRYLPPKDSYAIDNISMLDTFMLDYKKLSYSEMVNKYINECRNNQTSTLPKVDNDTATITLPDDWYEITRIWVKDKNGECVIPRLVNGEHRRKTMFKNLLIRRLINPDLSIYELIYALCFEMSYYIDNKDYTDIITKKELIQIACDAMATDPHELNYTRPREYIINYEYCKKHGITKAQVRGKINAEREKNRKTHNNAILSQFYKPELTIQQNIDYIEELTGNKYSKITIKRWKKENGLTRNYKKKIK